MAEDEKIEYGVRPPMNGDSKLLVTPAGIMPGMITYVDDVRYPSLQFFRPLVWDKPNG